MVIGSLDVGEGRVSYKMEPARVRFQMRKMSAVVGVT